MPDTPLYFHTITELATLIKSRQLSPVEVTQALLERITRLDGHYKSYATVMADQALAAARMAERDIRAGAYRGPLHGVPVAVKDLCFTEGVRTMGGTRVLADHVPNFDATVVARLQVAGAILLGKLNLTEGAMGGYHPDFAIPVNPWHAERYAGASSSGSGVATAAGLCFGSLGSDTGGSIRVPRDCVGGGAPA
jgi:amidase